MICPNCKKKISEEQNFCPNCGYDLRGIKEEIPSHLSRTENKKNKNYFKSYFINNIFTMIIELLLVAISFYFKGVIAVILLLIFALFFYLRAQKIQGQRDFIENRIRNIKFKNKISRSDNFVKKDKAESKDTSSQLTINYFVVLILSVIMVASLFFGTFLRLNASNMNVITDMNFSEVFRLGGISSTIERIVYPNYWNVSLILNVIFYSVLAVSILITILTMMKNRHLRSFLSFILFLFYTTLLIGYIFIKQSFVQQGIELNVSLGYMSIVMTVLSFVLFISSVKLNRIIKKQNR